MFNTGLFIVRVNDWSKKFFKEVWETPRYFELPFHEQSTVEKVLVSSYRELHYKTEAKFFYSYLSNNHSIKFSPNIALFPRDKFNSPDQESCLHGKCWVYHPAGKVKNGKLSSIKHILKQKNLLPEDYHSSDDDLKLHRQKEKENLEYQMLIALQQEKNRQDSIKREAEQFNRSVSQSEEDSKIRRQQEKDDLENQMLFALQQEKNRQDNLARIAQANQNKYTEEDLTGTLVYKEIILPNISNLPTPLTTRSVLPLLDLPSTKHTIQAVNAGIQLYNFYHTNQQTTPHPPTNPNRILIFTAYDNNYHVGDLCTNVNKRYAQRHGYHFASFTDTMDNIMQLIEPRSHCTWYKLHILLNEYLNKDDHDWIVWVDADAIFYNFEMKVEDVLKQGKYRNLIIGEDQNFGYGCMFNAGLMCIRNNDWSRRFWREVWEKPQFWMKLFHEQSTLQTILRETYQQFDLNVKAKAAYSYYSFVSGDQRVKFTKFVAIFPRDLFNTCEVEPCLKGNCWVFHPAGKKKIGVLTEMVEKLGFD